MALCSVRVQIIGDHVPSVRDYTRSSKLSDVTYCLNVHCLFVDECRPGRQLPDLPVLQKKRHEGPFLSSVASPQTRHRRRINIGIANTQLS